MRSMANDHYVAQTYLRHFGDPPESGRLYGYLKGSGKEFPCRTKDVCREWDGDINEEWITSRPELRGDFRKIAEPNYNPALAALIKGEPSPTDRFVISAMAATLMTCTPAWTRVTAKVTDQQATGFAIAAHDLAKAAGHEPELPADAVEALRSGEVVLKTDEKYVGSRNTVQLLRQTRTIYDQDWVVLRNPTDEPFITSDNPLTFTKAAPAAPAVRFLPLTPAACLEVTFTRIPRRQDDDAEQFDFTSPPRGVVRYAQLGRQGVKAINRLTAQCAEDLVLTTRPSAGIRRLVEKYAKWGLDSEFIEQPVPGKKAVLHGSALVVRER